MKQLLHEEMKAALIELADAFSAHPHGTLETSQNVLDDWHERWDAANTACLDLGIRLRGER